MNKTAQNSQNGGNATGANKSVDTKKRLDRPPSKYSKSNSRSSSRRKSTFISPNKFQMLDNDRARSWRLIYLWSKANIPAMVEELHQFSEEFTHCRNHDDPITDLWQEFHQRSMEVITTHVPTKHSSARFNQPWCDNRIRQMSRRKKREHRKAKRT